MKKHEVLTNNLREKIVNSSSGAKLPSVRGLMLRYGLSISTVNTALRQLEKEGLIETRQGSGIYVSSQTGARYVEFHRQLEPAYNVDAKEFSLTRAIQQAGWKVAVKRHSRDYDDPSFVPNPATSAHIVSACLFDSKTSFFHQLVKQNVPIVAYGREAGPFNIDSVTGNDYQTMSLLVKHLKQLGHQRIAMLMNEPNYFEIERRRETFINTMDLSQLPAPIFVECHTRPSDDSLVSAYHGLVRYLTEHKKKPPFTALVTASSSGIIGALRALNEAGISVPRQCSLASYGFARENAFYLPAITESGLRSEDWGKGVVKLLEQRFQNPTAAPISFKIAAELQVRESTAPPPGIIPGKRKTGKRSAASTGAPSRRKT